VHDNLIQFLRRRQELFPFRRDLDLRQFLSDTVGRSGTLFPNPAKIFLLDEIEPDGYGFPLTRSPALDDLAASLERYLDEHITARGVETARSRDLLKSYIGSAVRLARNAFDASVLADYHSVFWLLHTEQTARLFTAFVRRAAGAGVAREEAERLKYALHSKWITAILQALPQKGFLALIVENPLIAAEEFISPDLRELRGYAHSCMRRDHAEIRRSFELLRERSSALLARDRLLRRAITLLGYPEKPDLPLVALLDPRVRQLLADHPDFVAPDHLNWMDSVSKRLIEFFVVHALRRGFVWIATTPEGENVADDNAGRVYSRAIRPMNFGRKSIVEPIVYRYGLVYDINSFTETLGEIVRGGKDEEQTSYRQMLEFQRDLANIVGQHGLQFEKFLGDGAFYTSRRATRVLHAAIAIQQFYADARRKGFAFNRGMRIALNFNYYRLLPMQVSADGTQLMEFYGPGIVELSRLTTGKATKELQDIQHLLLAHGYDQNDVYRFFAPLSRSVDADTRDDQREFFAFVNENGHLINEGIVVSIPFIKQLSQEVLEDAQKVYRLGTAWGSYFGFPSGDRGGYIGVRLLGSVSLKGIGMQEIGEAVWLSGNDADVSLIDAQKPLLQLLQQERHRSTAHAIHSDSADLVVCAGDAQEDVILVGEWDPVSEEVRRPIRLDGVDTERYGLATPLTFETIESQSAAYQKLYRNLSRLETLPSFPLGAIRENPNFNGFIIGATVERL
jgi:hypothetical protein